MNDPRRAEPTTRKPPRVRDRTAPPVTVLLAIAFVALVIGAALLAPTIAPHSPTAGQLRDSMLPPSWIDGGSMQYILGTDLFGRDQLSRLLVGARVSLSVATIVVVAGGIVGATLGMIAGYKGGFIDAFLMRLVDIAMAFPVILIAIVLAVVTGPSYSNTITIIALLIWPRVARQIRGDTLVIARTDYVVYAAASGVSTPRIILRHVLPNVAPTLLVVLTLEIGLVILLEASLSFLGAGIPPPNPSWGLMVSDGRGQVATGWWISLFPGVAILLTVMSFNLIGDWLRDTFDPKRRR